MGLGLELGLGFLVNHVWRNGCGDLHVRDNDAGNTFKGFKTEILGV